MCCSSRCRVSTSVWRQWIASTSNIVGVYGSTRASFTAFEESNALSDRQSFLIFVARWRHNSHANAPEIDKKWTSVGRNCVVTTSAGEKRPARNVLSQYFTAAV